MISDDAIEDHLKRVAPQHVNGFKKGWLRVERFNFRNFEIAHIYSEVDEDGNEKPIATVVA